MKKVYLVFEARESTGALESLRDAGAVHLQHVRPPHNDAVQRVRDDMHLLERAVEIIKGTETARPAKEVDNWRDAARAVVEAAARIEERKEERFNTQALIAQWQRWGNFDPRDIERLRERGVFAGLYEIPVTRVSQVAARHIVETIFVSGKMAHCLVVSREEMELPFKPAGVPPQSLRELAERVQSLDDDIARMSGEIDSASGYRESFERALQARLSEMRFQEALAGMGAQESLVYAVGFCPVDALGRIEEKARAHHWAMLAEDPGGDEKTPTLIRNPRWVQIVRPVFDMMNIVPGYREMDISFFFLLFFSVFFGMLIGDAGYGAVFFILTAWAQMKFGRKAPNASLFFLLYLLSVCAVIWGVLTGTFFGQEWLGAGVKPLLPWLRDNNNVQMLCFLIGAVHLSIAHLWRGILKAPSVAALAEGGWLIILWGMYFVARWLILDTAPPGFIPWLFSAGAALVIFFSRPHKNILKAAGPGIGDFLLNVVNAFTDIVSYIRLFAVGLATVAVADAFNAMAAGFGFHSFVSGLVTASILVVGHLLNLVLGAMAVLVHGLRLNVLEFSSHLSMEWSGIKYNPFRKAQKINA